MIWVAFFLALAGVVGLVACVALAARLRPKLHGLGAEAKLLGERAAELQDAVAAWQRTTRD